MVISSSKDEDDVQDVIKKMAPCGVETIVVDLKKEIAEGAFEAKVWIDIQRPGEDRCLNPQTFPEKDFRVPNTYSRGMTGGFWMSRVCVGLQDG